MNTLSALSESAEKLLEASRSLTDSERLALALAIWKSLPKEKNQSELTAEQEAEFDRRWQDHLAHPEKAIKWEEGKARLTALSDAL